VRSLTPTPVRTVLAATPPGPAAVPAARTMMEILVDIADRYTAG
jgi:hypothetical protein